MLWVLNPSGRMLSLEEFAVNKNKAHGERKVLDS